MIFLATRHRSYITHASGWLLSQGVEVQWETGEVPGTWTLDIPVSDAELVADFLAEMLREDQLPKRAPMVEWVPLYLQPPFSFALCFSALLVVFYYYVGGYALRAELFEMGLFSRQGVEAGQWWRFITGATLHADWAHVLGNAAFIMVLGWAVAERVGVGFTALSWVLTAVAGFVASWYFSEATITVGASGGLFGLLGVAGGHGYRNSQGEVLLSRRIREIGAACSLLAFTAFSARANIAAHLGGFFAGILMGLVLPRRIPGIFVQTASILLAAGGIWAAWYWALSELKGFSF